MSTIALYRLVNNLEQLVSATTSGDNSLEYIKHASSRDDAGVYRCKANNKHGNGYNDILLSVKCRFFYRKQIWQICQICAADDCILILMLFFYLQWWRSLQVMAQSQISCDASAMGKTRAIRTQSWERSYDCVPFGGALRMPVACCKFLRHRHTRRGPQLWT